MLNNKELKENIFKFNSKWRPYTKQLRNFIDSNYKFFTENKFEFKESGEHDLFKEAYELRKLIYLIGEHNLDVDTVYSWNEYLINHPHIKEIGFITPFSFLVYWVSLPHILNLTSVHDYDHAICIASEFLERLSFQYPELSA